MVSWVQISTITNTGAPHATAYNLPRDVLTDAAGVQRWTPGAQRSRVTARGRSRSVWVWVGVWKPVLCAPSHSTPVAGEIKEAQGTGGGKEGSWNLQRSVSGLLLAPLLGAWPREPPSCSDSPTGQRQHL